VGENELVSDVELNFWRVCRGGKPQYFVGEIFL